MTKEELVAEKALVEQRVDNLKASMRHLREQFTKVLVPSRYEPYSSEEKTMSWEEIFFKVGEIKSEANHNKTVEENVRLEREVRELKSKINELKSKLKQDK